MFHVVCNDLVSISEYSVDHFMMGLCSKRLFYIDFFLIWFNF